MINFIDVTDFADNEITLDLTQYNTTQFESIASTVIYDVLNDLLGAKLYNELIDDLDGTGQPQTQLYIDLVDGITYLDAKKSNRTVNFQGIKKMLRYFVYVSYKLNKLSFDKTTGTVQPENEGSKQLTKQELMNILSGYYNKAVELYRLTVKYLNDNWETYFTSTDFALWYPKKIKPMSAFEYISIQPVNGYQLPGGEMSFENENTIIL